MKNIMLHAYCADNLGDDLFIKYICGRFPNARFHMQVEGAFARGLSRIDNLILHRSGFFERCLNRITGRWITRERLAKHCDGLVHIGGSIFIQNEGWRTKYKQYSRLLRCAGTVYVIGANFGPYYTKDYLDAYRELIAAQLNGICFRDRYSYGLFSAEKNVSWAPDILFASDYSSYISEDNRVVLSLMDKGEDYICKMTEIGDFFSNSGYKVILMSFCSREGDTKACVEVKRRMSKPCKIYSYDGDVDEALSVLGGAKLIVASRFHSMILGWAMGKKVFPITYSEKMHHVIEDIYPQCAFCDIERIQDLTVQEVLAACPAPENLPELRVSARNHMTLIRGLVE